MAKQFEYIISTGRTVEDTKPQIIWYDHANNIEHGANLGILNKLGTNG